MLGGTGFIGRYLEEQFTQLGYSVEIISRQPGHIPWTDRARILSTLEDAELLINLAGKSVNCRYNNANKTEILRSSLRAA
ncbi:NAD-dependent epimerase/dehydratase family protein [Paenibacillus zeirhizosphaerae]|uniref:NAD-dependent epimerase/dehydratase family protein n=1 Tax=Paenibacillus zeirhizosphaerae TaxID=2987519 RepID=UPI0035208570